MLQVLIALIASVSGAAVGVLLHVLFQRTPVLGGVRATSEAVSRAWTAVREARWVFNQAVALSGRLGHPWECPTGTVECMDLLHRLDEARSRIQHRRFRHEVSAVMASLEAIWVDCRIRRPFVAFAGQAHLPTEQDQVDAARQQRQLDAARQGLEQLDKAIGCLQKLSRRL